MRKLLLLLPFLGLAYFSQAQTIINNIGGVTTLNKVKNQITIDSAFRKPLDTLLSAPVYSEAYKNGLEYYKTAAGHWALKLAGLMLNYGNAPGWETGTFASRPAASTLPAGTHYTAIDLGIIYLDTLQTGWKQISSAGGGNLGDSTTLYIVSPLYFANDSTLALDTVGAHYNAKSILYIPISRIPPTNGQVLQFNPTEDSLVWGAGGGGGGTLQASFGLEGNNANLSSSDTIHGNPLVIQSNILPAVGNSQDFGTIGNSWHNGYFSNILALGTLAFNAPTGAAIDLNINGISGIILQNTRKITLGAYGKGANTGIAAYSTAVDTSGNIIETPLTGQYVGSVYKQNSSSGGTGWTTGTIASSFVQNVGATASSGSIATSAAGGGLFSDSLCLLDTFRSTHVKITVGIKMTSTQTSSTFGFAVAMNGINGFSKNSFGMFYNMATTNNGFSQAYYQNQSASSTWTQLTGWNPTSSRQVTNSTNDRIVATLERIDNQIHWSIWDQTSNSVTYDTTFSLTTTAFPLPNTWMPAIFALGGNLLIDSFNVIQTDPINPDIMCVGDSKGVFGQTTWQQTYPAILGYFYGSVVIEHGFGDLTSNILQGWSDVKRVHPKAVLYEGGSNDIRAGQSSITSGNVAAFADSCAVYGIKFIPLSPLYESAQDNSPQLSIFSAYPNQVYVFDIPKRTGGLYPDNIHLSNISAQLVARRIRESNQLPSPTNRYQYVPNSNTPPTNIY